MDIVIICALAALVVVLGGFFLTHLRSNDIYKTEKQRRLIIKKIGEKMQITDFDKLELYDMYSDVAFETHLKYLEAYKGQSTLNLYPQAIQKLFRDEEKQTYDGIK